MPESPNLPKLITMSLDLDIRALKFKISKRAIILFKVTMSRNLQLHLVIFIGPNMKIRETLELTIDQALYKAGQNKTSTMEASDT